MFIELEGLSPARVDVEYCVRYEHIEEGQFVLEGALGCRTNFLLVTMIGQENDNGVLEDVGFCQHWHNAGLVLIIHMRDDQIFYVKVIIVQMSK